MVRNFLRLGIKIFGAAGIALFLAIQIVLNSPLIPFLASDKDFKIQWTSGWSWILGQSHLFDLRIEGEDENVKWLVEIPAVYARFSVKALLQKELNFHKIKAPSVRFQLDFKESGPSIPYQIPAKETVDEWKSKRWKLLFQSILVERIELIRVHDLIYRGQARLKGGFFLWPGIEAEIGPACLSIQDGVVVSGDEKKSTPPWMEKLTGEVEVKFDRFFPYLYDGNEVLKFLSIHSKLNSQVRSVNAFNHYFKKTPKIRLVQGSGDLSAELAIEKGEIVPPSRFLLSTPEIQLRLYRLQVHGQGQFSGEVYRDRGGNTSLWTLDLNQFKLSSLQARNLVQGDSFRATAETRHLSLQSLFSSMFFSLQILDSRVSELNHWNRVIQDNPIGAHFKSGSGTAHVQLFARTGKSPGSTDIAKKGHVRLDLKKVRAALPKTEVEGDLNVDFSVEPLDLDSMVGAIEQGEFQWTHSSWLFPSGHGRSESKGWWMQGTLSSIGFRLGKSFQTQGRLTLQMKDTLPLLSLYRQTQHLPDWQFRLLKANWLDLEASFKVTSQSLMVPSFRLDSDSIRTKGTLRVEKDGMLGKFRIQYHPFSLGVELQGDKTRLRLFPPREWLSD